MPLDIKPKKSHKTGKLSPVPGIGSTFLVALILAVVITGIAMAVTSQPHTADTQTQPPATSGSSSTPDTPQTTTTTPVTIPNGQPLNDTVKQSCRGDQTGTYPFCMSPAPTLSCSGINTGSYYSYNCNDQSGKINCNGNIIGSIASNTCDYQKGAPYRCADHSIGSVINITCTGTSYLDNPT